MVMIVFTVYIRISRKSQVYQKNTGLSSDWVKWATHL